MMVKFFQRLAASNQKTSRFARSRLCSLYRTELHPEAAHLNKCSRWTCIGDLPETIGMLTALNECFFPTVWRPGYRPRCIISLERLDFCSSAVGRPDAADPPNCLLSAHKLTSIRLSGNYYSTVPTYLSSVTALQSLHIANKAIGSGCTASLSHLTALTKLVMQQCNLTAVPQSLAALSRLNWRQWTVDSLPLQVDQYLVIWGLIKQLPRLQHLFIDMSTEDDGDDDLLSWSKASLQQIASLKKIMNKRKR
ncbi:TPA: hypothetical protein ACH3X1_010202 [Trebouxia sp. C0004]